MASTIYKLDKDTLVEISSEALVVSNVQSIGILHIHDNSVSDSYTLNFSMHITDTFVTQINDPEFMVVIRERVDATSRGPNDITITNAGDDLGKKNYNKVVPYRPWELPDGFRELKGKDE